MAWRPVLLIAVVMGVVHLAVAGRFGWHRDEFYYLAAGRHLAWGYVDQPPLTPLLARLAGAFPGGVWPLRVVAIAVQLGCIALAAMLARELGGGRRAQGLTALAVAGCPIFVASSLLLGTTVTDQFFWIAVLVLVARALRRGDVVSWLLAGVVAGVGLENKHSLAVLLAGIFVGFAVTRRDPLRGPGPWLLGAVAFVIWLPNLTWNAVNGWPALKMAASISGDQGGPLGSLAQFPFLLLLSGPLIVVLWLIGVRWLWSSEPGQPHRWLVWVAITALVLVTVGGGKPYYPAPVLTALFAAGSVAVERRVDRGVPLWRMGWARAAVLSAVVSVLIGLPVLTPAVSSALRPVDPEPMETYAWPAFARQVASAARSMPRGTVVFTSNYGEVGALDTYGHAVGLRLPVTSAHNSWATWGRPRAGTPDSVLAVGEFDATNLRRTWNRVVLVRRITLPHGYVDEETDNDAGIYRCSRPKGTWAQLWPTLSHIG